MFKNGGKKEIEIFLCFDLAWKAAAVRGLCQQRGSVPEPGEDLMMTCWIVSETRAMKITWSLIFGCCREEKWWKQRHSTKKTHVLICLYLNVIVAIEMKNVFQLKHFFYPLDIFPWLFKPAKKLSFQLRIPWLRGKSSSFRFHHPKLLAKALFTTAANDRGVYCIWWYDARDTSAHPHVCSTCE